MIDDSKLENRIEYIIHRATEDVRCIAGSQINNCPKKYKDSLTTSVIHHCRWLAQEILERSVKEHLEIASRLQKEVDKSKKISRNQLDFKPDDFSRR